MMKKLLFLCAMLLCMTSCSTTQRSLRQLDNLATDIEQNGQYYNVEDWQNAYQDYKEINSNIDSQKLTSAQRQQLGQLKGRCVSGFAKSSVKSIKNAISEGAGIIEGIIEGLTK